VNLNKILSNGEFTYYTADNIGGNFYYASRTNSGDVIMLEDTLRENGIYIFSPIAEVPEYADKFEQYMKYFYNISFIWIENPNDPLRLWKAHGICCINNSGIFTVTRTFGLLFGDYLLNIMQGAEITFNAATSDFNLSDGSLKLICPNCILSGNRTVMKLSSAAGQISFETTAVSSQGLNIFENLGVGIRYSLINEGENETDYETGFIRTFTNPVFSCTDRLNLSCSIYPLDIQDDMLCSLKLEKSKSFASNLTSLSGRPLTCTSTDTSKLVFHKTARYAYDKVKIRTSLRLGFEGEFDCVSEGDNSTNILCGLSGTEYFQNSGNGTLKFSKGGGLVCLGAEFGLSELLETSYISVSKNTIFYSQPKSAPYFKLKGDALSFMPMPQYEIMENDDKPVPLLPYSNMQTNTVIENGENSTELVTQIERVLSKKRHDMFAAVSQKAANITDNLQANNSPDAVSTQGIFIWLSENTDDVINNWESIGFAKILIGGSESYLKFKNITAQMRTQFQQSNLYISYGSENQLPDGVTDETFAVSIYGFNFQLFKSKWNVSISDKSTVMIVKYRTDQSIVELEGSNAVIKEAINSCNDENGQLRNEFAEFLRTMNSKVFQGVVFLNPKVDVFGVTDSNLNIMIEGIGEDKEHIYAHHLIFPRNKVKVSDTILINPSKFSGIIDYKSNKKISFNQENNVVCDADFLTSSFTVVISDSELQDVRSKSELLINKLFGETVVKKSEGGNSLIIEGKLIKQDGQSLMKYSLQSNGVYDLKSKLRHVLIEGVELTTADHNNPRFTINGRMYFQTNTNGDLFSYGLETEDDNDYSVKGLPYGNLVINKIDDKFKVSVIGLTVIPFRETARKESMARKFPYFPESFLCGNDYGKSPKDLGYIAIQSPEQQSKIDDENWYGIIWRVPLGTLGNLSGNETIDMRIITAWSPTGGLYIGIKLPFGGNGFDLQGLLTLGFKAVKIAYEQKTETTPSRYIVTLTQFTISVLSLSFPPGSNTIALTSNEDGTKLGWLAAYAKD
jgi:hypothetical protein